MALYLDPKNDLTFKKIFYEHSDLLLSFLNALIPLPKGQEIETIEYVPVELVPRAVFNKDSSVDVLCKDNYGRQFIVEMQMFWHTGFESRIVFNASKAYVQQLKPGEEFKLLKPVYSLGILNDIYDRKTAEFYHYYKTINIRNSDEVFEGLQFIMIELPKFNPVAWADRKMSVLWLRFLKELKDKTTEVSKDLLNNEIINKAINVCEIGAYTKAELYAYDKYWDIVSKEKTASRSDIEKGEKIGIEKGRKIGIEEGEKIGIEKGEKKERIQVVLEGKKAGLSIDIIATITKLTPEQVSEILTQHQDEL
jgi:predicted transposase/invertase (TIGR01784 family)